MPAAERAAELAMAMWPSTRSRKAGWPPVTGSRSACGQCLRGPEGVVPSAAEDPCAGSRGFWRRRRCGLHFGERGDAGEVDGEALQAGVGEVRVGVVEAGHGEGAVQVDLCALGAAPEDVVVGAGEDDAVAGDGEGLDALRWGVVVEGVEADAGEDVAVEVDGVAALGVGGGEDAEEAEECGGLHVDESRSSASVLSERPKFPKSATSREHTENTQLERKRHRSSNAQMPFSSS